MSERATKIALRRLGEASMLPGQLDDVVVRPVEMFRAEILDHDGKKIKQLWLCCYLPNGDRITWHVTGRFDFDTVEMPERDYEDLDSEESAQPVPDSEERE